MVCEPEDGEIKKRRYAKRGDGTRRHGRPPDLTLGRPFGHSESLNMGAYPGRGPALNSRADKIIRPPTTPSATTTVYLLEPDEWVESPEVVLKRLHRTLVMRVARSLRHRKCFPIDNEEWNIKVARPLLYEPRAALLISLIAYHRLSAGGH